MKIRSKADGKVYAVHDTHQISLFGIRMNHVDYEVTDPADLNARMVIDGYQAVRVPDDTPVDVP